MERERETHNVDPNYEMPIFRTKVDELLDYIEALENDEEDPTPLNFH